MDRADMPATASAITLSRLARWRPSLLEGVVVFLLVASFVAVAATLAANEASPSPAEGQRSQARADIRAIKSGLEGFIMDEGRLPTAEEGLSILAEAPPPGSKVVSKLPAIPLDPWGRPYHYRNPGQHSTYDLFSLGPDGTESADDVTNWWPY